jgi:hypothetical protein
MKHDDNAPTRERTTYTQFREAKDVEEKRRLQILAELADRLARYRASGATTADRSRLAFEDAARALAEAQRPGGGRGPLARVVFAFGALEAAWTERNVIAIPLEVVPDDKILPPPRGTVDRGSR